MIPPEWSFLLLLVANDQNHPQLLQEKKARAALSTGIDKTRQTA